MEMIKGGLLFAAISIMVSTYIVGTFLLSVWLAFSLLGESSLLVPFVTLILMVAFYAGAFGAAARWSK